MGKHHPPRPRGFDPGGFRFPVGIWVTRNPIIGANDVAIPDEPRPAAAGTPVVDAARVAGDRRQACLRRTWRAAALALMLLFVSCESRLARAAASCAPYTPADGWTCEPPTHLAHWKGLPICVCAPSEVAIR